MDACSHDCPWRFGDSLTFMVNLKDVLGPGLRLRLRASSDVMLGPVHLKLSQLSDLGEAGVDLRHRALPGCVRAKHDPGGAEIWGSPVLLIPLSHVRGGVVGDENGLGEAVAHMALAFSTDTDPERILAAADAETRTVKDELANHADRVMRWLNAPVDVGHLPGNTPSNSFNARIHTPGSFSEASDKFTLDSSPYDEDAFMLCGASAFLDNESKRSLAKRRSNPELDCPLPDPDLEPEGWISYKGPSGRINWHHRSLGPAPWEKDGAGCCSTDAKTERILGHRSTHATSFGPIVSPILPSDGWVSFQRPDGRIFWHHVALGPAPWEMGQEYPLHENVVVKPVPCQ